MNWVKYVHTGTHILTNHHKLLRKLYYLMLTPAITPICAKIILYGTNIKITAHLLSDMTLTANTEEPADSLPNEAGVARLFESSFEFSVTMSSTVIAFYKIHIIIHVMMGLPTMVSSGRPRPSLR